MTTTMRPPTFILALLALAPLTGCALTSAAPGGPLHAGTTTQIQPSWALAYGPGSATIGGTRVTGNAESYGGTRAEVIPAPVRIGLRQSLGSAVEASADLGWLDSGVELRAGTPRGAGDFPFAVAAGVRRGPVTSQWGERTFSGHARFEIYPDVSREHDGSLRLTLSAGIGTGSFTHSVTLPESYRSTGGDAPNLDPFGAIVVRPETRLELGIGIYNQGVRGSFAATLLPWIVLDSGTPTRMLCSACTGASPVTEFSQSWGVSLVITPTGAADIIGKLTGDE